MVLIHFLAICPFHRNFHVYSHGVFQWYFLIFLNLCWICSYVPFFISNIIYPSFWFIFVKFLRTNFWHLTCVAVSNRFYHFCSRPLPPCSGYCLCSLSNFCHGVCSLILSLPLMISHVCPWNTAWRAANRFWHLVFLFTFWFLKVAVIVYPSLVCRQDQALASVVSPGPIRNTSDGPNRGTFHKPPDPYSSTAKVIKNKERARNHHSPEEAEGRWWLNVLRGPGWGSGTAREH